jgi:hypothetical protein
MEVMAEGVMVVNCGLGEGELGGNTEESEGWLDRATVCLNELNTLADGEEDGEDGRMVANDDLTVDAGVE